MYKIQTHVHFVGIGGIGMSGIARILAQMGYTISGCDNNTAQTTIRDLEHLGIKVHQQQVASPCSQDLGDIVVSSTAIPTNHPDLLWAVNNNKYLIHRSVMLAEIMRRKFSVAVTGTHGKTTTTGLIAHILCSAQLDPTYIIGGYLNNQATNAHHGSGTYCIAEADESDRSLLNLPSALSVITNIDFDHAETYVNLDDIMSTLNQFISKLPFYGKLFFCYDDDNSKALIALRSDIQTISYGLSDGADVHATEINEQLNSSTYTLHSTKLLVPPTTVTIPLPGKHNLYNSLAAFSVCKELGIDIETIVQGLCSFAGIDRRFSFRGFYGNAHIFDDYGHHPHEIRYALESARKQTRKGLTVIFQPHRYSRTQALWHEFVELFSTHTIEHLIITDIYAASEQPIENITSEKLVQAINHKNSSQSISHVPYDAEFSSLKKELATNSNDVFLFVGAGSITNVARELANKEGLLP